MTTDVVTLGPDDALVAADELMGLRGFRHLPVVDGEGHVVGLLNRVDMLRALVGAGALGARELLLQKSMMRVRDVMTRRVAVVDEDTPLVDVARRMRETRHSCLPVVREGVLVGLVTEADFVGVALELLQGEKP